MIVYNKLVRDKIPEIINEAGKKCDYTIIQDNEEFINLLEEKVMEEWSEYKVGNRDIEEIADMVEILLTLAEKLGTDRNTIFDMAEVKKNKRGGFSKGILLKSVE